MRRISRHSRGFTLIEIGVVLLVVAMLLGIALPTLNSVTGATTRGEIGKLASNIRAVRGVAAVSGQTCRMVFDLDENGYMVECAEGRVNVAAEKSRNDARDEDDDEELKDPERMTEEEKSKAMILRKAAFAATPTVQPQGFSGDLKIASVYTSHQEEPYKKGKAFLYFFPSGLAERANIQLQDGDDYFTIQVSSVAGRVKVKSGRHELKEERDE